MKELYEKVKNSLELLNELMSILAKSETEGEEVVKAEIEAFAARNGADVTYDEIKAFLEELQASGELSDSELDMVAGGKPDTGKVVISVLTAGTFCLMFSANDYFMQNRSCKEGFEHSFGIPV